MFFGGTHKTNQVACFVQMNGRSRAYPLEHDNKQSFRVIKEDKTSSREQVEGNRVLQKAPTTPIKCPSPTSGISAQDEYEYNMKCQENRYNLKTWRMYFRISKVKFAGRDNDYRDIHLLKYQKEAAKEVPAAPEGEDTPEFKDEGVFDIDL